MVSLFQPGGPLMQLANLCFFMGAMVSDVLLIRMFLVLAYVFIICAAALGMPKWPSASPTGWLAADSLVWASLSLAFHGLSFCRLVWDEHQVSFASEDEEQLWRFFHRRCGMGRLEMAEVLRFGGWRRVTAGAPVLEHGEGRLCFCLLVEGRVLFQAAFRGQSAVPPTLMRSGSCFDMSLLNVFGCFIGLEKGPEHSLAAVADTDCLLYTWSLEELNAMATQLAPAVGNFWRSFALCQLGLKLTWSVRPSAVRLCATGQLEPEEVQKGRRSRDFTDPLREYERPGHSLLGALRWVARSFHPFPPRGMRHTALPVTGIMARNRLIALKTAQARAIIERNASMAGSSKEEIEGLSVHGGEAAFELLVGLPTLSRIQAVRVQDLAATSCPRHSPHCAVLAEGGCGGELAAAGAARHAFLGHSVSAPSSLVTRRLSDVA